MIQRSIRELKEDDFDRVFKIANTAFPPYGDKIIKREAQVKKGLSKRGSGTFYGCFEEDDVLVGLMELYDMKVNIRGKIIDTGGLGFVSVDAFKKRRGVASEMLRFYMEHYRQQGTAMAILYPVSIEFYRKKGFVCATRMHQYRIKPASIPDAGETSGVSFVGEEDKEALTECFRTYFKNTNGMIMKREVDIDNLMQDNMIAVYRKNGIVEGYIAYNYQQVNPDYCHMDDMLISEWVWNTREAFAGLASFLNSMSDQIKTVILNTPDENLFLALSDPSNGMNDAFKNKTHEMYVTASDSMYKIIDAKKMFSLFADYNFGGADVTVKLKLTDSFTVDKSEEFTVKFENGKAFLTQDKADVEVSMNIDAFTAMFCGTADFAELYRLNCADISDENYVEVVSHAFHYPERPKTITYF